MMLERRSTRACDGLRGHRASSSLDRQRLFEQRRTEDEYRDRQSNNRDIEGTEMSIRLPTAVLAGSTMPLADETAPSLP